MGHMDDMEDYDQAYLDEDGELRFGADGQDQDQEDEQQD